MSRNATPAITPPRTPLVLEVGPREVVRRIPCVVCGRLSSGFHYGADTCSACKIFFRRNCKSTLVHKCNRKSKSRKSGSRTGRGNQTTNQRKCTKCRFEKCVVAGMAIEASKKGRYTFLKKHDYIMRSMELTRQLEDESQSSNSSAASSVVPDPCAQGRSTEFSSANEKPGFYAQQNTKTSNQAQDWHSNETSIDLTSKHVNGRKNVLDKNQQTRCQTHPNNFKIQFLNQTRQIFIDTEPAQQKSVHSEIPLSGLKTSAPEMSPTAQDMNEFGQPDGQEPERGSNGGNHPDVQDLRVFRRENTPAVGSSFSLKKDHVMPSMPPVSTSCLPTSNHPATHSDSSTSLLPTSALSISSKSTSGLSNSISGSGSWISGPTSSRLVSSSDSETKNRNDELADVAGSLDPTNHGSGASPLQDGGRWNPQQPSDQIQNSEPVFMNLYGTPLVSSNKTGCCCKGIFGQNLDRKPTVQCPVSGSSTVFSPSEISQGAIPVETTGNSSWVPEEQGEDQDGRESGNHVTRRDLQEWDPEGLEPQSAIPLSRELHRREPWDIPERTANGGPQVQTCLAPDQPGRIPQVIPLVIPRAQHKEEPCETPRTIPRAQPTLNEEPLAVSQQSTRIPQVIPVAPMRAKHKEDPWETPRGIPRDKPIENQPGREPQQPVRIPQVIPLAVPMKENYKEEHRETPGVIPSAKPMGNQEPWSLASIPVSPATIRHEVATVATNITRMCEISGTFPKDFFTTLPQYEQKYLECKAISQQMIGSETALPLEDYIRIYHDTGVDIDGRLHHIRHRVTSYASRLVTYMKFMSTIPGFLNLPEVDRDALASVARTPFGALTEYPCFNLALGLYTTPDGVTRDVAEMQRHSPAQYVQTVFRMAGRLQALRLSQHERNLLKCIVLFSPDDCLTVEGATEAEKQRRFYIQMLEFVNRSRSQPNSIPALMDTLDNLRKEVNDTCATLRAFVMHVWELIHWEPPTGMLHFIRTGSISFAPEYGLTDMRPEKWLHCACVRETLEASNPDAAQAGPVKGSPSLLTLGPCTQ